jgi:hypothetical protein
MKSKKYIIITIVWLLTTLCSQQKCYSQYTDTLTAEVNYRLLQGAECREQLVIYKKIVQQDSITIKNLKKDNVLISEQWESEISTNQKKSLYIKFLFLYSAIITIIAL